MGLALKSHLLSGRPHFGIFTFYNFYIARSAYTRSARPFTSSSTAFARAEDRGAW